MTMPDSTETTSNGGTTQQAWNAIIHNEGEDWMRLLPLDPRGSIGTLILLTTGVMAMPVFANTPMGLSGPTFWAIKLPIYIFAGIGTSLILFSIAHETIKTDSSATHRDQ